MPMLEAMRPRSWCAFSALLAMTGAATGVHAEAQMREALYPKAASAQFAEYRRFGPPGPFYPDAAARRGIGGSALMECKISTARALSRCQTIEEKPGGFGFADAARAMASKGWMVAAPKADGQSEDAEETGRFLVLFRVAP